MQAQIPEDPHFADLQEDILAIQSLEQCGRKVLTYVPVRALHGSLRTQVMSPGNSTAYSISLTDVPPDPSRAPAAPPPPPVHPPGIPGERERLGDYVLHDRLGGTERTETWRAVQASVNREVALERLKPEVAANEQALREFRALVRARASVVHQYIVPVYEAQESGGTVYYTRELVRGRNLAEMHRSGMRLDPHQVSSIFLGTSEAMAYFDGHGVVRSSPGAGSVWLGNDGITRVDNLALGEASGAAPVVAAEIQQIAQSLSVLLHRGMRDSAQVDTFLKSVQGGAIASWQEAVGAGRELLRRVSANAHASTARKGADTGQLSRSKGKPPGVGGILVILGATVAVIAGAVFALRGKSAPPARDFESMTKILAGSYRSPDGSVAEVPEFWIDTHEVSIGQYARFLEALETGAADAHDHPKQPASKMGHEPKDWAGLYGAARAGGLFRGQPVDLNCPIVLVDWWDAYAYANWKGRRLPTAIEWARAALGKGDRAFPWGDNESLERFNSGADFNQAGDGGSLDGHNFWCPVDAMPQDRSREGVIGLAGNVSEWVGPDVASWMPHADFPLKQVPAAMGGSFAMKSVRLTVPRPAKDADARQLAVGFRTASSRAP